MDRLFARLAPVATLHPVGFDKLTAWRDDNVAHAMSSFQSTCKAIVSPGSALRLGQSAPIKLSEICQRAVAIRNALDPAVARRFFEEHFQPYSVLPKSQDGTMISGFLTGYYEPVIPGSLTRTAEFTEPLLSLPQNHVVLKPDDPQLDGVTTARMTPNGKLEPYAERKEIEQGALAKEAAVVAWVQDGIEAFMIHVQGSARIRLQDGSSIRLKYAGRNGHPYTSIGRILVTEHGLPANEVNLSRLKEWVRANGQGAGQAGRTLMQRNKSFIFFQAERGIPEGIGPVGGAGVALTAMRSIAVDRNVWPYGLPFWIDGTIPWRSSEPEPFRRLMVAQDTGSAILGPARADLFFGSGPEAGALAGNIRHPAQFYVFLPK